MRYLVRGVTLLMLLGLVIGSFGATAAVSAQDDGPPSVGGVEYTSEYPDRDDVAAAGGCRLQPRPSRHCQRDAPTGRT